jgi:hypothetical protein
MASAQIELVGEEGKGGASLTRPDVIAWVCLLYNSIWVQCYLPRSSAQFDFVRVGPGIRYPGLGDSIDLHPNHFWWSCLGRIALDLQPPALIFCVHAQ